MTTPTRPTCPACDEPQTYWLTFRSLRGVSRNYSCPACRHWWAERTEAA